MDRIHAVGIDPGLVDTGLVRIELDRDKQRVTVRHAVVKGIDAGAIADWVGEPSMVIVEKYTPRANYSTDERMVQGERDIMRTIKGAVTMRNTGVKTVVTPALMQLLGVWKFSTPTNHGDLRSAARIAILGMMKNEEANEILSACVRDHLDDDSWEVRHED